MKELSRQDRPAGHGERFFIHHARAHRRAERKEERSTRQCKVLNLSRSGVYYVPVLVDDRGRELMKFVDRIPPGRGLFGTTRIRDALQDRGHMIGRSHVRTFMRKMGIEALYRKPRLSKSSPEHTIYPYLSKGLAITEANKVRASDIAYYIPMAKGFCCLVAANGTGEQESPLLEALQRARHESFRVEAPEEVIQTYGAPEIFNTDQGSAPIVSRMVDHLSMTIGHRCRVFLQKLRPLEIILTYDDSAHDIAVVPIRRQMNSELRAGKKEIRKLIEESKKNMVSGFLTKRVETSRQLTSDRYESLKPSVISSVYRMVGGSFRMALLLHS